MNEDASRQVWRVCVAVPSMCDRMHLFRTSVFFMELRDVPFAFNRTWG